jgi:hypothetical protein
MKTVTPSLRYLTALAALVTLSASDASAQTVAASFQGLSVAINANFNNSAVDVTDSSGNSVGNFSSSNQNFLLQMAKGIAIGSSGVANFGASAVLGDVSVGSVNGLQVKSTGNYALYGELGYALDTRSLVYGKFSLNRLTGELSGGGPGVDTTLSADGTGFGFGYRQTLTQGLYLQGEWMQQNYQQVTSSGGLLFKPSGNGFMVGVGYKL